MVGNATNTLRTLLPDIVPAVKIKSFPELYDSVQDLVEFRPDSLWIDATVFGAEDIGSLRLLKRFLPECRMVLVMLQRRPPKALVEAATAHDIGILKGPPQTRTILPLLVQGRRPAETEPAQQLLAGLADQLNNPLAALAGRLQLMEVMLTADADRDLRDNLHLAQESTARLRQALWKLSILGGRRKPNLHALPLRVFLEGLLSSFEAGRILLQPVAEKARVQADEDLFRTAVTGVVAVTLDLARHTPAAASEDDSAPLRERMVEVEVESPDDGMLPILIRLSSAFPLPCRVEELFEPFRLGRLLTDPDLGLDLSVAKSLLEAQGGRLEPLVDSGFLRGFRVSCCLAR
ncbi:MAG: hypothetical protein ACE5F1_05735 [Planctomycetota bacterium]